MNASKENGRKALEELDLMWENPDKESSKEKCDFIERFIEAAIRKLPSEASYAKEKTRKRKVKSVLTGEEITDYYPD